MAAPAAVPVVEGSIALPPPPARSTTLQTLDEPVLTTILRDLKRVAVKLRHVVLPGSSQEDLQRELRDWDLWGPLILCLTLSIMLSLGAQATQQSLVFASVFVIVWVGAAVITVNAQLLGGNISFFQSVCVLGYCVFPLVAAAVLCHLSRNAWWRAAVTVAGLGWSTYASAPFMHQLVPPKRQALAVFPLFLFFALIAWLVFVQ